MENKVTGFPKYWKRMKEHARMNGNKMSFAFWSGALSAQQYVQRTALVAALIFFFVGAGLSLAVCILFFGCR